ncbi:hypothetical protein M2459_000293 [Parabacteroides sp. PF5-5]|uniref:hypothetical protein n=1 Tax=unclassified Parabacteroides TaxID=2649774 RepID=UPI002475722C|nr:MULTISPECIES: hypothetical protein [unclassified Parabacteroides]MDH6303962.1 hypothetical protein [Parabacteroides sp. PH5-39]MDH6314578.1 hypothetical protein [Parabacteroides sp. PF5-13]MDH6318357.1 hypothetical protein [Parabacteroides sp. PH5-13]MDH6322351.1 hypothetical protein [Parabacteroides sp. PH5-8]MDH6325570.1 hypothetical protein [Parabacteroides sp. PH5-41]
MFRGSKADEVLTLLFMLLAIGAIVCYFAVSNRGVFLAVAGVAVIMRIVQYLMRYFK